jgi:hypothetical protein
MHLTSCARVKDGQLKRKWCREPGGYACRVYVPVIPEGQFIGLAYQGEDIVFRFIIEYSSLRDFGP